MTVRELTADDLELVDAHLPLNRLDTWRTAAVDVPRRVGRREADRTRARRVGRHRARAPGAAGRLSSCQSGGARVWPPALTHGGRAARAPSAATTGSRSASSVASEAPRRLYAKLGYADAGVPPKRVRGTIILRGEPFEVDDTLVYLVRDRRCRFRAPPVRRKVTATREEGAG